MRIYSLLAACGAWLLISMASCTASRTDKIAGNWKVETYVDPFSSQFSATLSADGGRYVLQLHDSGFFSLTTDCNTVSGNYSVSDSKLRFIDPSATEMACEHEAVERCLKAILPLVDSYDCPDDSTLMLLGSSGNSLIKLTKLSDITERENK